MVQKQLESQVPLRNLPIKTHTHAFIFVASHKQILINLEKRNALEKNTAFDSEQYAIAEHRANSR